MADYQIEKLRAAAAAGNLEPADNRRAIERIVQLESLRAAFAGILA